MFADELICHFGVNTETAVDTLVVMVFGSMRQQLRQSVKTVANRRAAASASASFASAPRAAPAFVQARTNAAFFTAQPQHLQADPTGVVAGIAIVGALIGVGKMWWDASSSPSGATEPPAFQEIPQAEIVLFFAELTDAVTELLVRGFVEGGCYSVVKEMD